MKIFKTFFCIVLFLLSIKIYAQNALVGKEFIICKSGLSAYENVVYFQAFENTTIKLTNPLRNYNVQFNLAKDSCYTLSIDTAYLNYTSPYIGKQNNGIHVTSSGIISLKYYNRFPKANTAFEMTSALPISNYGNYYQIMNTKYNGNLIGLFSAIDSNYIEVNATDTLFDGQKRKGKFTIMLNKNETYNFLTFTNTAGSSFKAINPTKPFGMISTEVPRSMFYKGKTYYEADANIMEYIQPSKYFGKKFYLSPLFIRNNFEYKEIVRFTSTADGTISLNGRTKSLKANKTDTFYIHQPSVLESSTPIQIQQITPPQDVFSDMYYVTNSIRNIIPWHLKLKSIDLNLQYKDSNTYWVPSDFNIIYPKKDRTKIRVNGIRLDSTESIYLGNYRRFTPFPYDTSMEICATWENSFGVHKKAKITSQGSGFIVEVFQSVSVSRLCSYTAGFLNKALDVEMRINGTDYFYENENFVPYLCHQPTLFNCQTNYPADAWLWRIEDSTYTTQSITHSFKDTGIKKIMMVAIRKDGSKPNSTIYVVDTLVKYIRLYTAPFVKFNTDTLKLCIGNPIILNPLKYADDSLLWALDINNLSCTNCNSPKLMLTKNSPATQKIIALARLQGCTNARDTLIVQSKGAIKLTKLTDTTLCYGNTISLPTAAKGGNAATFNYVWLLGKDTIKTLNISPIATATYKLKLTDNCSKDSLGKTIVDSIFYKVNVLPKLSINKINDYITCKGNSVNIALQLSGGIKHKYTLKLQDSIATDTLFSLSPTTSTIYKFVLADGCSKADTMAFTIVVNSDSIKINNAKLNDTVCNKTVYNLAVNGYSKNSLPLNYAVFTAKDSLIESNTNGGFSLPLLSQSNQFKIKIKSICNSIDSVNYNIISYKNMQANIKQTPICYKDTTAIALSIKGGNAERYKLAWQTANQTISTDTAFLFSTKNKNTTLRYTLTDNCSTPLQDSLELKPMAIASLIANNATQCQQNNLFIVNTATDSSKNVQSKINYFPTNNWTTISSNLFSKTFADSGKYMVRQVVVSNSVCIDSTAITLTVLPAPIIKITWQRTTNSFDNSTWRFTATANRQIQTYIWQIDNRTPQQGNPIFEDYSQTGLVKIKVNAKDFNGCTAEATDSFDMQHRMKFYLPNAVSLNSDGLNDAFKIPGAAYIKDYDIKIYNRWGQLVFKSNNPYEAWIPADVSNNLYIYTLNIFDIYNERHELKGVIEVVQ